MLRNHSVIDTDVHYKIDGVSRTITNINETKRMLVQNDHNSEMLTFDMPRFFDGHDFSECNFVQVHYVNADVYEKNKSAGIYEVQDLHVSTEDENRVVLTWLVSGNATKYAGTLNFTIRFSCIAEDGTLKYAWNTTTFKGILIEPGIYNSNEVVEENVDILAQWKADTETKLNEFEEEFKDEVEGVKEDIKDIKEDIQSMPKIEMPVLKSPVSITVDNENMKLQVENHDAPFIIENKLYIDGDEIRTLANGQYFTFSNWVYGDLFTTFKASAYAAGFKESAFIYNTWYSLDNGTKGLNYWETDITAVCTGIGTATVTAIEVASQYNRKPVISITDNAFENNSTLELVITPDTLEYIGGSAFRNSSIKRVILHNGVGKLGSYIFRECKSLENIVIPESVYSIGNQAFRDCVSLNKVTFRGEIDSLTSLTFHGCTSLTDIYVPWSEDEVEGAPWGAPIAKVHYNSPKDFTYTYYDTDPHYCIESKGAVTDTDIVIPNTYNGIVLDGIGTQSFRGDTSITSVTITEGVKHIGGESAFQDCFNLRTVVMPQEATYIQRYAFKGCIGLTDITINKLSWIYKGAFQNCKNLKSVRFTKSSAFLSIATDTFSGCVRLTDIYVPWNKGWVSGAPWGAPNATVHYGSEV